MFLFMSLVCHSKTIRESEHRGSLLASTTATGTTLSGLSGSEIVHTLQTQSQVGEWQQIKS